MFVLIVGGGRYGTELATELASNRFEVAVIEKREPAVEQVRARVPSAIVVHGDGDEPIVLEAAHVSRADIVVAAADEDEDNLVACLLARREYAVPRTYARVNAPHNEWLFGERFGVDEVAPPDPARLAARIAESANL